MDELERDQSTTTMQLVVRSESPPSDADLEGDSDGEDMIHHLQPGSRQPTVEDVDEDQHQRRQHPGDAIPREPTTVPARVRDDSPPARPRASPRDSVYPTGERQRPQAPQQGIRKAPNPPYPLANDVHIYEDRLFDGVDRHQGDGRAARFDHEPPRNVRWGSENEVRTIIDRPIRSPVRHHQRVRVDDRRRPQRTRHLGTNRDQSDQYWEYEEARQVPPERVRVVETRAYGPLRRDSNGSFRSPRVQIERDRHGYPRGMSVDGDSEYDSDSYSDDSQPSRGRRHLSSPHYRQLSRDRSRGRSRNTGASPGYDVQPPYEAHRNQRSNSSSRGLNRSWSMESDRSIPDRASSASFGRSRTQSPASFYEIEGPERRDFILRRHLGWDDEDEDGWNRSTASLRHHHSVNPSRSDLDSVRYSTAPFSPSVHGFSARQDLEHSHLYMHHEGDDAFEEHRSRSRGRRQSRSRSRNDSRLHSRSRSRNDSQIHTRSHSVVGPGYEHRTHSRQSSTRFRPNGTRVDMTVDDPMDTDAPAILLPPEEEDTMGLLDEIYSDTDSTLSLDIPTAPPNADVEQVEIPVIERAHTFDSQVGTQPATINDINLPAHAKPHRVEIMSAHFVPHSDKNAILWNLIPEEPAPTDLDFTPFQWVHLTYPNPTIEIFEQVALSARGITGTDRNLITGLIGNVGRQYGAKFRASNGRYCNYLRGNLTPKTKHFGPGSRATGIRSALFLAIPYFSLEEYNHTPAMTADEHPTRTLLQVMYASTTNKSRELDQAICHVRKPKSTLCLHVRQTWALLLNDQLLVTCSHQDLSTLQSNSVRTPSDTELKWKFNRNAPQPWSGIKVIRRFDGKVWLFPVSECSTWMEFCAKFRITSEMLCHRIHCVACEEWDENSYYYYYVKRGREVITSLTWQRLIEAAMKSVVTITLRRRTVARGPLIRSGASSDPAQSGDGITKVHDRSDKEQSLLSVSTSSGEYDDDSGSEYGHDSAHPSAGSRSFMTEKQNEPYKAPPLTKVKVHLLTWIRRQKAVKNGNIQGIKEQKQPATDKSDADVLFDSLLTNPRAAEREIFSLRCRSEAYADVEAFVKKCVAAPEAEVSQTKKDLLVSIFKSFKQILEVFLPFNSKHTLAMKYWGAVQRILKTIRRSNEAINYELFNGLHAQAQDMKCVAEIINTGPETIQFQLPKPFFNAFHRFLMAFLFLAYYNDGPTYREHMIRGSEYIWIGLHELMALLAGDSADYRESVSPWLFLSKLCERIHYDICQQQNLTDVDEIYRCRLQQLSNEVLYGRTPRAYQAKFSMLEQELQAVAVILKEQETVCKQLLDSIRTRIPKETALLESSIERSPEIKLTQETLRRVRSKISAIDELYDQNEDMRRRHLELLQSDKDRQEAAIFTFTIVTVVFLPLSFVAGVLGMNTNDIRNMQTNQWVYWVSALPLTVLIIVISLYVVGELPQLFPNPFRGRRHHPGAESPPDKAGNIEYSGAGKYEKIVEKPSHLRRHYAYSEGHRRRQNSFRVPAGFARRGTVPTWQSTKDSIV